MEDSGGEGEGGDGEGGGGGDGGGGGEVQHHADFSADHSSFVG